MADKREQGKSHIAYQFHEVLSNLPTNIDVTSLAVCSNDVVFVGTKSGHLVIYTIRPLTPTELQQQLQTAGPIAPLTKLPYKINLTKSIRNFSKKPVLQMAAIDELQILISLTDSIQVYSIKNFTQTLSPPTGGGGARGAQVDAQKDSKKEAMPLLHTLQIDKAQTPPSLFCVNTTYDESREETRVTVCVICKKSAHLFTWSERSHSLVPAGGGPLPSLPDFMRSAILTQKHLICGSRQQYYRITLRDGTEKPLSTVGTNMDSVVAKLGSEAIAVGHDNEIIPLSPEGDAIWNSGIKFDQIPSLIEYDEPYILALTDTSVEVRAFMRGVNHLVQKVEISSPLCVTKFNKVIWIANKKCLFRLTQRPTEIQITGAATDKQFKIAELLAEKTSEPHEKKITRINLIRTLDALDKFNRQQFPAAFTIFKQLKANPIHILGLYPDLITLNIISMFKYPQTVNPIAKKDLDTAIKVLVEYLQQIRKELIEKERKGITTIPPQEYFSLATTTTELPAQFPVASLREVIDTALMKSFVLSNDPELGNLLRLDNNRCSYDTTVKVLENKRRHKELVLFYQSRKRHPEALKLLRDLSGQQNTAMSGHEMTVSYLQKLGADYLEVIFEYSRWVLKSFPNDGLQIFTDESPECKSLPANKVVKFLKDISNKLVIQYLEYIIMKRGETKQDYHNALAMSYKDEIVQLQVEYQASMSEGQEMAKAGQEPGELGELRRKLLQFLTESEHYDPRDLLVSFPMETLYIEQAILNGRMGNHDKALSIYIHVLKEPKQAELYCESIVSKKLPKSNWENVYFSLFCAYIDPKAYATAAITSTYATRPNVDAALRVLGEHWDMINMERALRKLPDWVPLKEVSSYLENVLRKTTNQKRDDQILRSLLSYEAMRFQKDLDTHLAEKFEIFEDVCDLCKNKIGNSKFVRCAPFGESELSGRFDRRKLLHLNCFKNQQTRPRDRADAGRFI